MTDIKTKLEELREQLAAIEQEQNAEDADTAVSAAITARHLRQQIATFEKLAEAERKLQEQPKPITDRQALTAIIQQRKQEHTAKLDSVRQQISNTRQQRSEQQRIFESATAELDTAKAIGASEEVERLTERERHLAKMLEQAEKLPVFESGELSAAWADIVSQCQPTYSNYITAILDAAQLYRDAIKAFEGYHNSLVRVRGTYTATAKAHNIPFEERSGAFVGMYERKIDKMRIRDHESGWLFAETCPPFCSPL